MTITIETKSGQKYPTPEDRLVKGLKNNPENGCWEWTGLIEHGYGYIQISGDKRRVHRFAYETWVGPIPSGLVIDHTCRNKKCANPKHLEPVTHRENTMRGVGLTARNAKKTHCMRGHEFTKENTYNIKSGGRICRACQRHRQKLRYRRLKATV